MLKQAQLNEVRRLLAEKLFSQRRIAQRTGASRRTVAAIANANPEARVATTETPTCFPKPLPRRKG